MLTDDTLLNDIGISRCLFFVNDIFKKVLDNNGISRRRGSSRPYFEYDEELIKTVYISPYPISLSEITRNVRAVFKGVRLSYYMVARLLSAKGILIDNPTGMKAKKVASPEAAEIGIWTELVRGYRGEYYKTVYDKQGQRYVLKCLKDINKRQDTE